MLQLEDWTFRPWILWFKSILPQIPKHLSIAAAVLVELVAEA
jgi:hypothetical protein